MGKVRFRVVDHDGQELVEEIHEVVVHSFTMGDVDDPDIYAAQPLYDWQQSPAGQYVMENAIETPIWHRQADPINWGHRYVIVAELEKKKLSEFYLRFDKVKI
jgi:hypothetical protein